MQGASFKPNKPSTGTKPPNLTPGNPRQQLGSRGDIIMFKGDIIITFKLKIHSN